MIVKHIFESLHLKTKKIEASAVSSRPGKKRLNFTMNKLVRGDIHIYNSMILSRGVETEAEDYRIRAAWR